MSIPKPNAQLPTFPHAMLATRRPLHNNQIERAEQRFYVKCVVFGSVARDVAFEVLATTPKGAIRIARSFYPRSEKHQVFAG